jgi:hypothetical protein
MNTSLSRTRNRPWGLLEPDAWKAGSSGSEGAGAQQCAPATRGFNVRRYRNGKLLIKPSAPAVRRLKRRLAAEMRALRGSNVTAVLAKLVPIMRGWAAYYRTVVSSKVFRSLDH